MIKLNLPITRPLIFFDLETTGVDVNQDRILEIFAIKYYPDGEIKKLYHLLDPILDISEEATSKHGHSNKSLKGQPTLSDVKDDILEFFDESDLGGHNSNHFDIQMLVSELKRLGVEYDISKVKMVDTRKIYLRNNPKELSHLYYDYTGKELINAHSAEADVLATVEIFNAQIEKYGIKTLDEADLIGKTDKKGNKYLDLDGKFIKTLENKYVYNFGKHKGEEVSIENSGFLGWMLNTNFSEDTKRVARILSNFITNKATK